jgi:signal transduction histidine kinase
MLARVRRVDPRIVDGLLAAALAIVGQLDAWAGFEDGDNHLAVAHDRAVAAALLLVATLAVAWRRRQPFPALVACLAAGVALALVTGVAPFVAGLVPVLLLVYAIAAYGRDEREQWAGLALAAAASLATCAAVPRLWTASNVIFNLAVIAALWLVGMAVHARSRRADRLAARAVRAEQEREAAARAAVAEERARIARELHDVIAHAVSVMLIQTGAAEQTVASDRAAAEQALATVRRTGKGALLELRRLLDLLREHDDTQETSPQPGIEDVAPLVEQLRRAGLRVRLERTGACAAMTPGVGLAVYRIVQEALVNVLKHAPGARATVAVHATPEAVEVEVLDDGRDAPPPTAHSNGGHGLVGMRERVQLYGGSFEAGPRPGGGFRVAATLPLGASVS